MELQLEKIYTYQLHTLCNVLIVNGGYNPCLSAE